MVHDKLKLFVAIIPIKILDHGKTIDASIIMETVIKISSMFVCIRNALIKSIYMMGWNNTDLHK